MLTGTPAICTRLRHVPSRSVTFRHAHRAPAVAVPWRGTLSGSTPRSDTKLLRSPFVCPQNSRNRRLAGSCRVGEQRLVQLPAGTVCAARKSSRGPFAERLHTLLLRPLQVHRVPRRENPSRSECLSKNGSNFV